MKKKPTETSKQPRLFIETEVESAIIYIDGASRGNPGNAGLGVLLKDGKGAVLTAKKYLGTLTNNQAEYEALIAALILAKKRGETRLTIHTDSLLVANQINGKWRVQNPGIAELFKKSKKLMSGFEAVHIEHIPREQNRKADKLANDAIDEYFKKMQDEGEFTIQDS